MSGPFRKPHTRAGCHPQKKCRNCIFGTFVHLSSKKTTCQHQHPCHANAVMQRRERNMTAVSQNFSRWCSTEFSCLGRGGFCQAAQSSVSHRQCQLSEHSQHVRINLSSYRSQEHTLESCNRSTSSTAADRDSNSRLCVGGRQARQERGTHHTLPPPSLAYQLFTQSWLYMRLPTSLSMHASFAGSTEAGAQAATEH